MLKGLVANWAVSITIVDNELAAFHLVSLVEGLSFPDGALIILPPFLGWSVWSSCALICFHLWTVSLEISTNNLPATNTASVFTTAAFYYTPSRVWDEKDDGECKAVY